MRIAIGAAALLCIGLTGCGGESRGSVGAGRQAADYATCRSEAATEVASEPPYTATYLHRWRTADGCPVRLDYVMTRTGEGSCGGTGAADLLTGWPLGASHDHRPFRIFVRDPDNIFEDRRTSDLFDEDADLPHDAVDTGFRQDEEELWMRPGDDAFVYLVRDDKVERWPLDRTPPGCA